MPKRKRFKHPSSTEGPDAKSWQHQSHEIEPFSPACHPLVPAWSVSRDQEIKKESSGLPPPPPASAKLKAKAVLSKALRIFTIR